MSLEDEVMARYGVAELLPPALRTRRPEPLRQAVVRRRVNRAQVAIERRNFDIRRLLWKYSSFVEQQRLIVRRERDELLAGGAPLTMWRDARPERAQALVRQAGPEGAAALERALTLDTLDSLWADHLQRIAEVREAIHLVRLGNQDPLLAFLREADTAFMALRDRYQERVVERFDQLALTPEGLEALRSAPLGPSATWTYLVDDDPFRGALRLHVAGDLGLSIGAAIYSPLYMLAAIYRRIVDRRGRRHGTSRPGPPA